MRCLVCQVLASHAMDGDRSMPAAVRRHLGRCESCAAAVESMAAVDRRLRDEARRDSGAADRALHDRIMRGVREAAQEPAPAHARPLRAWAWTAAAAAAAAAVAVIFAVRGPAPSAPPDQPAALAAASHLGDASGALLGAASRMASLSDEMAAGAEQTLASEYERLRQDMVGAARVVADTLGVEI